MVKALLIILIMICLFSLDGCSTSVLPVAEPDVHYKMDMSIYWNKDKYKGHVVLPKRPAYELHFKSPGKMDLFTFKTCSREIVIEKSEFKGNDKMAVVHYVPNEIEEKGGCLIELGAYEKIKGRHSWAMMALEHDRDKLPAQLICGGTKYSAHGVSLCEQREELIQLIRFQFEVLVKPKKGCEIESGNRGKEFRFNIKKGFCTYVFMETKKPYRTHWLTTRGYEKILLREE